MFSLWRMVWGTHNTISDVINVIAPLISNNEASNICKLPGRYFYSNTNVATSRTPTKDPSLKLSRVYLCNISSRDSHCCYCAVTSCRILNNRIESWRVLPVHGSRNRPVLWGTPLWLTSPPKERHGKGGLSDRPPIDSGQQR